MGVLDRWVETAREQDTVYLVEKAKLDFAFALEAQRRRAGLTYADISRKLDKTRSYIAKVFRGDENFTIETMVKLSRAVGGELQLDIAPQSSILQWTRPVANEGVSTSFSAVGNSVVRLADYRLNGDIAA